jgi:hypothetical protein
MNDVVKSNGKAKRVCTALCAAFLLVFAVLIVKVPANSQYPWNTTWNMGTMNVHFQWNGTWDDTAYWAYGMAVFAIYDWAYQFGWYGLGWDQLTGGNWWTPPTEKFEMYFFNDPKDNREAFSGRDKDNSNKLSIWMNVAYMGSLNLKSEFDDGWVGQVLRQGSTLSHEASHCIMNSYLGGFPNGDNNWLTESLAWYTGSMLWPWYHVTGAWTTNVWAPEYDEKYLYSNHSFIKYSFKEMGAKYDSAFDEDVKLGLIASGLILFQHPCDLTGFMEQWNGGEAVAKLLQNIKAGYFVDQAYFNISGVSLNLDWNYDLSLKNKTKDFRYWFDYNYRHSYFPYGDDWK